MLELSVEISVKNKTAAFVNRESPQPADLPASDLFLGGTARNCIFPSR